MLSLVTLIHLYHADLLTVIFFFRIQQKLDSFILSKGHAAPALYSVFIANGFLKKEFVNELRNFDSPLQGHPDRLRLPEVGASTGALGQGLSMSIGRAIGKTKKINLVIATVL